MYQGLYQVDIGIVKQLVGSIIDFMSYLWDQEPLELYELTRIVSDLKKVAFLD